MIISTHAKNPRAAKSAFHFRKWISKPLVEGGEVTLLTREGIVLVLILQDIGFNRMADAIPKAMQKKHGEGAKLARQASPQENAKRVRRQSPRTS